MKTITFPIIIVTFLVTLGCDSNSDSQADSGLVKTDSNYSPTADYMEKLPNQKLEEIKIPDSVDRDLVIAIYDQELPTQSRIILYYTDTTFLRIIKGTYSNNKITDKEELLKIKNSEFKTKSGNETYLIKPNHVSWAYSSGATSTSWEYIRLDNVKNFISE